MSTSAFCAPNGLTQIPIAKVFGDGVASLSLARAAQSSQTTTFTAQYGGGNMLEFGVDYQSAPAQQQTFQGNVKYLVAHRPRRLPDIAVGLVNLATGQKPVPYAVATTQPRATGISLGVIRPNESGYESMAGVSYNVTPAVELVSDYIGGRQNYGTVGIIASLNKTVTLNLAYAAPNAAGANPQGYVVNLAYTFHLKGNKGKGETESSPQEPDSRQWGRSKQIKHAPDLEKRASV